MTGPRILAVAIVAALVIGMLLRARRGKVRAPKAKPVPAEVRAVLAGDVTLVMFTTAFCANCKYARPVLRDLADQTDGLGYAEIDLTDLPDLAKQVSVLSTPTTLGVTADGTEILRVNGVPDREDILASVRPHLR